MALPGTADSSIKVCVCVCGEDPYIWQQLKRIHASHSHFTFTAPSLAVKTFFLNLVFAARVHVVKRIRNALIYITNTYNHVRCTSAESEFTAASPCSPHSVVFQHQKKRLAAGEINQSQQICLLSSA